MNTFPGTRRRGIRAGATALVMIAGLLAFPMPADATSADAPAPATGLQATPNFDEVKLSWTAGLGTVQTEVRGKAGQVAPVSPADGFPVALDGSLLPSATASDLDPSQPYTFAVFACDAASTCAPPAVVTVSSLGVKVSVSPDRTVWGSAVTITGTVVDAVTGAPVENVDLKLIGHRLTSESGELIDEGVSGPGGAFRFTAAPPEQAEFAVVAMGDATHLAGFGLTRTVSVSALAILQPVSKKGKLGKTFPLIAGAGPIDTSVPLKLQERVNKKWTTVLKKRPNKNGIAQFKVTPTTKGKHVYRVSKAKSPGVSPGVSRQVTLTVT